MQDSANQLYVCVHIHVTICKYHRKDPNFLSTDKGNQRGK